MERIKQYPPKVQHAIQSIKNANDAILITEENSTEAKVFRGWVYGMRNQLRKDHPELGDIFKA